MRWFLMVAFLAPLVLWPGGGGQAAGVGAVRLEPVIWQLSRDYPQDGPADASLPVRTMYLKTHDGTDWMATYDKHPLAVNGPERIRELIGIYGAQGIDVVAWFVPNGRDAEAQLQMAEQVLDAGVKGLYADVEAFAGFCGDDCWYLADAFWKRLRAERPNAELGVIYDPRPGWWDPAGVRAWLPEADVALPMCFWESYSGQQPWGDPGGCVFSAYRDLGVLAPGSQLEYVPMLQGDSSPERFAMAVHTANAVGARRVSIWRRGVVPNDVWDWARAYQGETAPCWVAAAPDCPMREVSSAAVYLIYGGLRFHVPNPETLFSMGYTWGDVREVPDGFLESMTSSPGDGTLLAAEGSSSVQVLYAGAKFTVPLEAFAPLGLDPGRVVHVPEWALDGFPLVPAPYTRFREVSGLNEYVIVGGARVLLDEAMRFRLWQAGYGEALYVVPDGGLGQVPEVGPLVTGDVSCNGWVDAEDALHVLREAAGMPNLGLCMAAAGDVNCSGGADVLDALAVMRFVAGLPAKAPDGCGSVGIQQGGS